MKKEIFSKFIGIVALLAVIVLSANAFRADGSDKLRLYFLDVGQGDAIFMETPEGEQILVDGGSGTKVLNELSKILPLGDTTIDLIVLTHNHSDHLRGLEEVLKHYEIRQIWISGAIHTTDTFKRFLEKIKQKSIPTKAVIAGESINFSGLEGLVIYPLQEMTGVMPSNQHDATVVTYWQYGENSWLLMGDAETKQERELLGRGLIKPVTILKIGHHGSDTSSSEVLLKTALPEFAVISVGKGNRYDHPSIETLKKLTQLNITVLRTDIAGTIKFSFSRNDFTYTTSS